MSWSQHRSLKGASFWILLSLSALACSSNPSPTPDADIISPDTAVPGDVTTPPDAVEDVEVVDIDAQPMDTGEVDAPVPDGDVSDGIDAVPPTVLAPLAGQPLPGSIPGTDLAAIDVDVDGFLDLAVLGDAGLKIWRYNPASPRPPLLFEGPSDLPATPSGTLLQVGDFDGDGRDDLAVYDPALGRVSVLLHVRAPAAFENPIIAFENPIIAFENPIIAFENPIIALPQSWEVGDFNGDGLDDFAFFVGSMGVSVGWTRGATSASGAAVSFELAQPAGLSDFENPIIARPITGAAIDTNGDGRDELAVGFDRDTASGDGLVLFESNDGVTFENPIIAFGTGTNNSWIDTPDGLFALLADDLNADGAADLAWAGSAAGQTDFGVWLSSGFENPIIAREPGFGSFAAASDVLLGGRLLFDEPMGAGAAGADALELLQTRRQLLFGGESTPHAHLVAVGPGALVWPVVRLLDTALGDLAVDFNRDGFSEQVRLEPTQTTLNEQVQLINTDYTTDTFTLADGSTVPMCELAAVPCTYGVLGICADARDACGVCDGGADFATKYGAPFATVHEPAGEQTCDDLDNDCDGVIDVVGAAQLDFSAANPATEQRFLSQGTGVGWVSIPAVGSAVRFAYLDNLLSPTLVMMVLTPILSTAGHTVRARAFGGEVGMAGANSSNHSIAVADNAYGMRLTDVTLPPTTLPDVFPVAAFGDWEVVHWVPDVADTGYLDSAKIYFNSGTARTMVSSGAIPGNRLLNAMGTNARVYALVAAADGSGGEELVWRSHSDDMSPQGTASLHQTTGSIRDVVLEGDDAVQCLAFIDDAPGFPGLALQRVSVDITAGDTAQLTAPVWEFNADPVVAGTLSASRFATGCRFWWLSALMGSPEVGVNEAIVDGSGAVTYRWLGRIDMGALAPTRFSVVRHVGVDNLLWSHDSTPGLIERRVTCP